MDEELNVENPWLAVKVERNRLLFVTDWTQGNDSPLTQEKQDEWKVYRQSLRDMFIGCVVPADVTWPKIPE